MRIYPSGSSARIVQRGLANFDQPSLHFNDLFGVRGISVLLTIGGTSKASIVGLVVIKEVSKPP